MQHYVIKFVSDAGSWFSPGTLVSSNNKTDRHDIHVTEILLKVALNIIGGGSQRKWRKPPTFFTCRKSLRNFITCIIMLYRVHLSMNGVRTHVTGYRQIAQVKQL